MEPVYHDGQIVWVEKKQLPCGQGKQAYLSAMEKDI